MNAFKANKIATGYNVQKEILDTIYSRVEHSARQKSFCTFVKVLNELFDETDVVDILKELGKDGYYASCTKRKNEKYGFRYEFYISWNKPMKRTIIEHEDRVWVILPEKSN